jgi:hypothetical protein
MRISAKERLPELSGIYPPGTAHIVMGTAHSFQITKEINQHKPAPELAERIRIKKKIVNKQRAQ